MYREYPSAVPGVVCTWERRPTRAGSALVVPDGCVDVMWHSDGRLEIAGPDTEPWQAPFTADDPVIGVRLAPGAGRPVLGLPLSELRDARAPGTELASTANLGDALVGVSAGEQRRVLAGAVAADGYHPDPLVAAAVNRMRTQPRLRVAALADELGVSARHLQRRFLDQVGYAPKLFARVARLQRFVAASRDERTTLADAAYDSGYASQSHLSDEVRELTGLTPVRFLEERRRPAA